MRPPCIREIYQDWNRSEEKENLPWQTLFLMKPSNMSHSRKTGVVSGRERAGKEDMGNMLDYIDMLNGLDTEGVEPMSHVFPVHNVFREDVVTNGDGHDATLANAPAQKDDAFKVPKTVE